MTKLQKDFNTWFKLYIAGTQDTQYTVPQLELKLVRSEDALLKSTNENDVAYHGTTIRDIKKQLREHNTTKGSKKKLREIILKMSNTILKELVSHKNIKDISIEGHRLHINTMNLYTENDRDIGKFLIEISTKVFQIRIYNKSYTYAGHSHWHVNSEGVACFGDFGDELYRYRNADKLYFYVNTIITFLRLAHTQSDAYVNKYHWLDNKTAI